MTAFSKFWAVVVGGGILGFAIAFMPWPKRLARLVGSRKATVKYWAIIAGVGALGLAMAFGPWPEWLMLLRVTVTETSTWVDLIRKVGEALFIGALLAILLDSPIKEKLLTEFAKDVSVHIIGESLPTRLREHLRDYLEMYCVRRNWTIRYTMTPKPVDNRHYVELTIQVDYDIENRASEPRDYHFSIELEKTWYKEAGDSRIAKLDLGQDEHFNWDTLRRDPRYKPTSAVEFFSADMKLPPFPAHVSEKETEVRRKHVSMTLVQYFEEGAFSPFLAIVPVMNPTEVTVDYDPQKFEVDVDPTFEIPRGKFGKPAPANQVKTWTINEPILPGQGFMVKWNAILPTGAPIIGDGAAPASKTTA